MSVEQAEFAKWREVSGNGVVVTMELEVTVVIGHVKLQPSRPGYVWLWWDDGEGMEIEEAKLATCLEEFYREHF